MSRAASTDDGIGELLVDKLGDIPDSYLTIGGKIVEFPCGVEKIIKFIGADCQ